MDIIATIAPYLVDISGIVSLSVGFTFIIFGINNEPTGVSVDYTAELLGIVFILAGVIIYVVSHNA